MSMFKGLTETQILEKAIQFEKDDGYSSDESKAYVQKKCERDGNYVIVVGYLQCVWKRRGYHEFYKDEIERYWCVMNSDGVCTSMHMKYWAAQRQIGITFEYKEPAPRVTNEEALALAREVKSNAFYQKDRDNCVPTAIAIVSQFTYEEVRAKALEYEFKPEGGGMRVYRYRRMMKEMGIKFEDITKEVRQKAKTTKTLDRLNLPGKYLVGIDGHLAAMVNGTLLDYSWNENRRIQSIIKIIS